MSTVRPADPLTGTHSIINDIKIPTHTHRQTILLFANYYALFKTGRDFLVFSKLNNREEECAHELEPM